ncbi:hypothetical protein PV10_08372 [Exophiala mesophila]|uniref:Hydrophobin n=1 Tax=Exophiala mesophila TaxID=212818 RepID=A0A0D1Z463_EXOME|nr:uncharacterized protein PV10_08372 [Exophiala mesophila]KIV88714.1 hypothetical protein PV10_08372 [Exophiala mesophila]
MQLVKLFALATLLASGALAVPVAEPEPGKPTKPEKPAPPSINVQSNQCGNGAAPYCCNTDNKGKYTTCKVLGSGSQCGATTVCCNAQNTSYSDIVTFDQTNVGCAMVAHPAGEPAATTTSSGAVVKNAPAEEKKRIGDLLAVFLVLLVA